MNLDSARVVVYNPLILIKEIKWENKNTVLEARAQTCRSFAQHKPLSQIL
jgi:hypothetical protein